MVYGIVLVGEVFGYEVLLCYGDGWVFWVKVYVCLIDFECCGLFLVIEDVD